MACFTFPWRVSGFCWHRQLGSWRQTDRQLCAPEQPRGNECEEPFSKGLKTPQDSAIVVVTVAAKAPAPMALSRAHHLTPQISVGT